MMERRGERLMRDGEREGEKKGVQRGMSHVFHVERAGGEADMETQRASSSMFVTECSNICECVCFQVCAYLCEACVPFYM